MTSATRSLASKMEPSSSRIKGVGLDPMPEPSPGPAIEDEFGAFLTLRVANGHVAGDTRWLVRCPRTSTDRVAASLTCGVLLLRTRSYQQHAASQRTR